MANSMTRWDPFREMVTLRDAMDSLFENALIGPYGGTGSAGNLSVPVDVSENEDGFTVRASVPGMNPEDLNVTVTENVVTIQGQVKAEDEKKEGTQYHVRERRWGSFSRQIALPVAVDANKVDADFNNGILTLTLPKSEEARPKRIQIRGTGQQRTLEGQVKKS